MLVVAARPGAAAAWSAWLVIPLGDATHPFRRVYRTRHISTAARAWLPNWTGCPISALTRCAGAAHPIPGGTDSSAFGWQHHQQPGQDSNANQEQYPHDDNRQ